MRKPHVDCQGFINCSTPEHVYILGLLWADGHILDKPSKHDYRISLKFHIDDVSDIVPVFLRTGPWASYSTRNGETIQWQLTTNNKPWVKFLVEHDYIAKSTASACKILAHIPESLRHYWWRGYFDGDGHISDPRLNQIHLDFASGLNQDWTFLRFLEDATGIKMSIRKCVTAAGNSSHAYLCGRKDIYTVGEYLYQGTANEGIGLKRKLSRLQRYLLKDRDTGDKHINFHSGKYHVEIKVDGKRHRKHGIGTIEEARKIKQEMYDSFSPDVRKHLRFTYGNILDRL